MAIDVTDATFQTEVLERSKTTPVIVDLWAPWCGPCKTIGPILEKLTDATGGRVILAKVNVDENPAISAAFKVQSIPAVYALKDGAMFDGFVGAQSEHVIAEFVQSLMPEGGVPTVESLLAIGDEASLREAFVLKPGDEQIAILLAELLLAQGDVTGALGVLALVPETDKVRVVIAAARAAFAPTDDYDAQLTALLPQVKADEDARKKYLDIMEAMGSLDPRSAGHRKRLTAQLF
jgi:putative thioredoxin